MANQQLLAPASVGHAGAHNHRAFSLFPAQVLQVKCSTAVCTYLTARPVLLEGHLRQLAVEARVESLVALKQPPWTCSCTCLADTRRQGDVGVGLLSFMIRPLTAGLRFKTALLRNPPEHLCCPVMPCETATRDQQPSSCLPLAATRHSPSSHWAAVSGVQSDIILG